MKKIFIYFIIVLFAVLAIVSAVVIVNSTKNKSVNNLGNPENCPFIQKNISVDNCDSIANSEKVYILSMRNSSNKDCNQDWRLKLECKDQTNLIIEVSEVNGDILLFELDRDYETGGGGHILQEIYGLKKIEEFFRDKFSGDSPLNCKKEVNYFYTEYENYGKIASKEIINLENLNIPEGDDPESYLGTYGGNEGTENKRECGKIYFIMYLHGNWDEVRYWAVEMDAETGKLIREKEVTLGDQDIDYSKIWWLDK